MLRSARYRSSQLPPVCSSAAHAATAYPQWMLLAPYGLGPPMNSGEDCNLIGDTKTLAAASTSSGHRIIVSVHREPSSQALSCICLFLPNTEIRIPGIGIRNDASIRSAYATVVAAHGGSVLVLITSTEHYLTPTAVDYFVYTNAAGAADPARPPSLHLLPPRPSTSSWWGWGSMDALPLLDVRATGFLCRGEADFVVAQLKMPPAANDDDAQQAELLLFRNGEWRVERPCIVHCHGSDGADLLLAKWRPQAVVPVGNGVLCWVDFSRGIIFSDVFHQTNMLRYVPYPAEARATEHQCFVCTNTRGELKLVSVSPRRCSHCGCTQHATAVDTWTLDTDGRAWVLETGTTSMVDDDDSTELWALDDWTYAHHHLVYPAPVASMNGGGGGHVVSSDESAAPTTVDENPSLQSSRTLSMPTRAPLVDRVVRRSPRILHKNIKDKAEYPHIRLDYGPHKRHKTVQVEELKLGNTSNSTSPI